MWELLGWPGLRLDPELAFESRHEVYADNPTSALRWAAWLHTQGVDALTIGSFVRTAPDAPQPTPQQLDAIRFWPHPSTIHSWGTWLVEDGRRWPSMCWARRDGHVWATRSRRRAIAKALRLNHRWQHQHNKERSH